MADADQGRPVCSRCHYWDPANHHVTRGKCLRFPPAQIGGQPVTTMNDSCGEFEVNTPADVAPFLSAAA